MEQFDQFFKDKFQGRQFDLNEAHWQAAEQLIIDQEKKKRRRDFFFWLLGGLLLLGVVGAGWYFWPEEAIVQNEGIESTTQNKNTADAATSDPTISNTTSSQSTTTSDNLDQTPSTTINTTNTVNERERSLTSTTKSSTVKRIIEPSQLNENTLQTIEELSQNSDTPTAELNQEPNIEGNTFDINLLKALPTVPLEMLFYPLRTEALEKVPQAYTEEQETEDRTNEPYLGLDFNFSTYPYLTTGTQKDLGGKLGLTYGMPLGQRTKLLASLHYQQRGGTFDFFKESRKVAYRFAKAEERFVLLPEKLHYAEAGLGIVLEKNKHSFEIGTSLNYLLGIRGDLLRFTSEDNFQNATLENEGWIAEDGFKKWHVNMQLGYMLRFGTRLGLGARLNYTLGTILDKNYEFSNVYLQEAEPLTLDLRFRYYLIK
jgi:cytoskeletal protein RodZ